MGPRGAQVQRARPSNRHPMHRLSQRSGPLSRGYVRPLVAGKLLQVCPPELQPGSLGRLSHRGHFRAPTGGQPRLPPPRRAGPLHHRQAQSPPGQLCRHHPERAHRAQARRAVPATQSLIARGDRSVGSCNATSTRSRPSARRHPITSPSKSCPRRYAFASSAPKANTSSIPSR